MRTECFIAYLSSAEDHPAGHAAGNVFILFYCLFIIIAVVTALAVIILLAVRHLKKKGVIHGRGDKLLDIASERGMVFLAEVIDLEAVKTGQLELKRFNKTANPGKPHLIERVYLRSPDSRVSYKPTVRAVINGKKYELPYHRYVSDRELRLSEGQTVRICTDPASPGFYVIVGDLPSYRYLDGMAAEKAK